MVGRNFRCRAVIGLLAGLLSACGSAVDFSNSRAVMDRPYPPDAGSQIVAIYEMAIEPRTTDISLTPVDTSDQRSFLAEVFSSANVQISNASTSVYDSGANRIRLAGINNQGLCLKNVLGTGEHLNNALLRLWNFVPAIVTPGEGAVSSGQSYTVAFGSIANGATVCRPFSLTDTSGTSYRFLLQVEGTRTSSAPTKYITQVNTSSWLIGDSIQITGVGLTGSSASQVCITPNPSESTFCASGTRLVPDLAALTTGTNTQLGFTTTSAMAGLSGFITVNNSDTGIIMGPYVAWTSALQFNLALPSGSISNAQVFLRSWDGPDGLDANNCPYSGLPDDTEIVNHVNLSTTPTQVDMNFLSTTGSNKNIAAIVDMDHSGSITAGDYIEIVQHADFLPNAVSKPINQAAVSIGSAACAIDVNGALYCFGGNNNGIGDGTNNDYSTPHLVTGFSSGVTAISSTQYTACVIQNGAASCWGLNNYGQLGDGTYTDRAVPTAVSGLNSGVTAIVAGAFSGCAIHNGALKCWGDDIPGLNSPTPVIITGLESGVTALSGTSETVGRNYCVIQNGAAKCIGTGYYGALGNGDNQDSGTPVQVVGLTSGVTSIAVGFNFACAVQNGAAKCWGYNSVYGELGDGTNNDSNVPVQVVGMTSGVTAIFANSSEGVCALQNNTPYCWGQSANGSNVPVAITGFSGPVSTIRPGVGRVCGVVGNNLECYGDYGAVGDGLPYFYTPQAVQGLGSSPSLIFPACAVVGGAAKCWGTNYNGSVGDGTYTDRESAVQVNGLTSGVTKISRRTDNACAVVSGAAKCWGVNYYGQLGNGTTVDSTTPVQVTGLTSGVTDIATGYGFACAVVSGAAKCWGLNYGGQIGDGTTTQRLSPVQVSGLTTGVTAITAGFYHACAIHSGTMKCWGVNNYGQLGNNSTSSQSTPVTVSSLSTSGLSFPTAGEFHTCVDDNGAAKCWGDNSSGQLGDSTYIERHTPVSVTNMTASVSKISAGNGRTCSIKNGAAYCWGSAPQGNSSYNDSSVSSPVAVNGLTTGVTDISVEGTLGSCAIASSTAYCWGNYAIDLSIGLSSNFRSTAAPVSGGLLFPGFDIHFNKQVTTTCP